MTKACLLCGSVDIRVVDQFPFQDLKRLYLRTCGIDIDSCIDEPYSEELVHLFQCRGCGLEFYPASLRGNAKLYAELSRNEYYYMSDKWEFDEAVKDMAGCASVLEIGCGRGAFLSRIRKANPAIRTAGLETNAEAVVDAQTAGLNVQAASIEEYAGAHPAEFDCVCIFQVLEHADAPDRFLRNALRVLRPSGRCIITTPNAEAFTRRAVNNFGDMPPHHLSRWTASVMREAASRLGVRVERVAFEPVAEYHKEWYRNTRTAAALARLIGWRLQSLELGLGYRLLLSLSYRLQNRIPSRWWKYDRYPGHTLYTVFRT